MLRAQATYDRDDGPSKVSSVKMKVPLLFPMLARAQWSSIVFWLQGWLYL